MPHDPDFHETAAAWLEGESTDGQRRLLGEILRDTPDATAAMASLARTEAALQAASLTQEERLARAARLIRPAPVRHVRRLLKSPAFRWAAAAVLVAGGIAWLMSGPAAPDRSPAPRLARKPPIAPRLTPLPATTEEAKMPAEDREFHRRMAQFILPEFSASGLTLGEAAELLRTNVKAIDPGAAPDFAALAGVSSDAPVHLVLRYKPVKLLVDLLAIQTGSKLKLSGRSYVFAPDATAPMPGGESQAFYALPQDPLDPDLPSTTPAPEAYARAFGERPRAALTEGMALDVTASERLHRQLKRLAAATAGTPPGSWIYAVKVVGITPRETQEQLLQQGAPQRYSDEEWQLLMRSLSQSRGVDLITAPTVTVAAGATRFVDFVTPDPDAVQNPDDWTGIRMKVFNDRRGDIRGEVQVAIDFRQRMIPDDPGSVHSFHRDVALTDLGNKETGLLATHVLPDGQLIAFFLSAFRADDPSAEGGLPYGIPVDGSPGMVFSPYAQDKGMVDVNGLKRGTRVMCPYSGKHFRVP